MLFYVQEGKSLVFAPSLSRELNGSFGIVTKKNLIFVCYETRFRKYM